MEKTDIYEDGFKAGVRNERESLASKYYERGQAIQEKELERFKHLRTHINIMNMANIAMAIALTAIAVILAICKP